MCMYDIYARSEMGAGKETKKSTFNVGFSKQLDGSIIPTSLNHDVYSSDHEAKKGRPNIVLCCQSCAPSLLVGDTPSILWIKVVVVVILAILVPSWIRQEDPGGVHHYLCDRQHLHHPHHIVILNYSNILIILIILTITTTFLIIILTIIINNIYIYIYI